MTTNMFLSQTLPVFRNFVTSRCIVVLFGTSLSGYALLNASQQQQTISVRSNVRELTHVQLVNTPCSHLHGFCANGVSSGLATRVTFIGVSQDRLGEYFTGVDLLLISFLYRNLVRDCCWVAFEIAHPV
jgi:hypothetical protein